MSYLSLIEVFAEVARTQSFTEAARLFGTSGSAVSKQIQRLELELNTRLFTRTTRKVSLTEEGNLLYETAQYALADLAEVTKELRDRTIEPIGGLRINVPRSFGELYLKQPLVEFAKTYPRVSLDVRFEDRLVDVVRDGYDAVIRIGAMADSSLLMRKLADCPQLLCAAPQYINSLRIPLSHPDQLSELPSVVYADMPQDRRWRWQHVSGGQGSVKLRERLISNTSEMMLEAVLAGLGVGIFPIFSVTQALENGSLVRILPEYESAPLRRISLLYPAGRQLSLRTRVFIDWMVDYCCRLPWEER